MPPHPVRGGRASTVDTNGYPESTHPQTIQLAFRTAQSAVIASSWALR